tara:strand:+ start:1102 stop:1704 length:603 start_codon:yes stop_codon:yes gene_type:complete
MPKNELIIICITALCFIVTACNQSYSDIQDVMNSLENHSPYNCTEENFEPINATAGLSCLINDQDTVQSIEIYTFENNASDECLNTGICHLMKDQSGTQKFLSFEKNILFITYNDFDGALGKLLIEDLKNGENFSYDSNHKKIQTNPETISKIQDNKSNIDLLIQWSNSMIDFSNDQTDRIQKLENEIMSLNAEIDSLNP